MEVCAGSVARGEPETGAKQPRHLGRPDGVAHPSRADRGAGSKRVGGEQAWPALCGRGSQRPFPAATPTARLLERTDLF